MIALPGSNQSTSFSLNDIIRHLYGEWEWDIFSSWYVYLLHKYALYGVPTYVSVFACSCLDNQSINPSDVLTLLCLPPLLNILSVDKRYDSYPLTYTRNSSSCRIFSSAVPLLYNTYLSHINPRSWRMTPRKQICNVTKYSSFFAPPFSRKCARL